MSYADEAAAIRSRFNTEWAAATPVAMPNVAFTPPNDASWVRLTILTAGAEEAALSSGGTQRYRHDGTISVQVFVPANSGDGVARTLAEQACAIFRGETFSGVRCGAPFVTEAGNDGNGWYSLVVWVPYFRDSLF